MEQGQSSTTTAVAGAQVLEGTIAGGAPLARADGAAGQPAQPQAQGQAQQSRPPRAPVPLMPSTFDDVFRMADALIDSSLIPERWLKGCTVDGKFSRAVLRSNLILALGTGVEIGLSPLQSLRELFVVHGHVSESVLSKLARVQASPLLEKFAIIESTKDRCIVVMKRVGQDLRQHEYTLQDAQVAGLFGRSTKSGDAGNWEKRAKLMLRRRAIGELVDEVFADVIKGIKSVEDLEEELAAEALAKQPVATTVPPAPETLRRVDSEPQPRARRARAETPPPTPVPLPEGEPAVSTGEPASAPTPAPASGAPSEEGAPTKAPERVKENPEWDEEAKALVAQLRATTSIPELDKVALLVRDYKGTWRNDIGKVLSDHRGFLRGGRG